MKSYVFRFQVFIQPKRINLRQWGNNDVKRDKSREWNEAIYDFGIPHLFREIEADISSGTIEQQSVCEDTMNCVDL